LLKNTNKTTGLKPARANMLSTIGNQYFQNVCPRLFIKTV